MTDFRSNASARCIPLETLPTNTSAWLTSHAKSETDVRPANDRNWPFTPLNSDSVPTSITVASCERAFASSVQRAGDHALFGVHLLVPGCITTKGRDSAATSATSSGDGITVG